MSLEIARNMANQFEIVGEITDVSEYGNGHINDTYLISTTKRKYILQKLNINVFKNYRDVINNIANAINFLKSRGKKTKLDFINSKDNGNFIKTEDACWRMYNFVDNCVTLDKTTDPVIMESLGRLNANFIKDLNGIDPTTIKETIKDFHDTQKRYSTFLLAVNNGDEIRIKEAEKEISFVKQRNNLANAIVTLLKSGEIPTRIIHNDTKTNNMLLDKDTLMAVCAIDLDTIMPGSLLYDFGDAVRYGCNNSNEDEADLSKVFINTELYKAYTTGFVQAMGNDLTPKEKSLLHIGAKVITYECGMRFLTDYLLGDTYFKIDFPKHNLVRARNQFKLLESLEKLDKEMTDFIQNL